MGQAKILLAVFLLLARLFAYDPPEKHGECWPYWQTKGYSTNGPSGKNTLFSIGGVESYDGFYRRLDRANCYKEWLIVVYMAADNDLSPYSFRDLYEMESVGSSASVDVVVFQDSADADGLRYYHIAKGTRKIDYHGELRRFVEQNEMQTEDPKVQEEKFLAAYGKYLVQTPAVKSLPEGDSGSLRTAGEFLRWAFQKYPSRRVLLIGWSHGEGFDAHSDQFVKTKSGKQGGFAFDFTSKSHMVVTEMARGTKALLAQLRQGAEIDIAGSDACLNQQVEFGYEWLGVAQYVFGSSTIVQKKGFNYAALLRWIVSRPYFPTDEFAREIPRLYGNSVSHKGNGKYTSYYDPAATMATWTMGELPWLRRALDSLADALARWINEPQDPIDQLVRAREIRKVLERSVRLGGVSVDLQYFLLELDFWAGEKGLGFIRSEVSNVMKSVERSVLNRFIGPKYKQGLVLTSKGVAVWLPHSLSEFRQMFPKFTKSRLYQDEGEASKLSPWAQFVQLLFQE